MLVALDKLTGKTIWQSKVPGASGGSPGGPPAVALATVLLARVPVVPAEAAVARLRRSREPKIRACSRASILG